MKRVKIKATKSQIPIKGLTKVDFIVKDESKNRNVTKLDYSDEANGYIIDWD